MSCDKNYRFFVRCAFFHDRIEESGFGVLIFAVKKGIGWPTVSMIDSSVFTYFVRH
jgi:hypothetical protein